MNFLHISDTHFLRDYGHVQGKFHDVLTRMTPPIKQLDGLLGRVGKPEFVLFTGDLCDGGEAGDYRALKEALATRFAGLPIFVVPGNHDRHEAMRSGWGIDGSRVRVERFGELRLVLLDSTDPDHPNGRVTDADCDALELALTGNAPALLLLHHHIIEGQFALPPAAFPERFRRMIENSGILAIFNGHTHHSYTGAFANKPCYTAGSLSFRGENSTGCVMFDEFASVNRCTYENGALRAEAISQLTPSRPLDAWVS